MSAIQDVLREQYLELRTRNSSFSLRSYARRLRVNSGVLSAVMNGRRRVSKRWVDQIVPRMGLSPERQQTIACDFQLKDLSKAEIRARKTILRLKGDEFHLLAEGIHFALLALFDLDDCSGDLLWMCARLGVSQKPVREALARLQRLKLVEKKGRRWRATGRSLRTSEGVSDPVIRRFHEERLEEASRSLYEVETSERDFLCSTVAIDKSKLPLARKLVREFLERLEDVLTSENKNEVYRIGVQIYPVTDLKRGPQ